MEYRGAKTNPEVFVFMKFEGAAFIRAVTSALPHPRFNGAFKTKGINRSTENQ